MSFSVRVEGIRFAAAHFATFGGECEPLHGHSYEAAAEVEGGLSADSWVTDFSGLRRLLREVCAPLDHRFILQLESELLDIERTAEGWAVRAPGGALYSFPAEDVAALPIDNSTAERLAEHLCGRLWERLTADGAADLDRIAVEVWEGPGQRARFERSCVAGLQE
ncbi:MAG TPA: 6-carboxytetrahydropterin synthase [Dehalococcoidia bacterium]|nr:6-carboxytetrahydropterin synthase [Dehalococcoidia bacterium]